MRNAATVLQTTGASMEHVAIGVLVLLAAGMLVAYTIVTKDDGGLNTDQQTVRDQVRAALDEPASSVRFDAAGIRSGTITRSDLADGLRDAFETDAVDAPETAGQAASEIRNAVGEAWRDATDTIPRHVLALGEWAVLVMVFGTIAVSSGVIIAALGWQAGRMTLGEYLDYLSHVATNGIDLAITLTFHFPYSALLFDLGFAYFVLLFDVVYHHPWLLASVMLLAAAGLFVLERRAGSNVSDPRLVRKRFIAAAIGGAITVWLAGTGVTVILSPALEHTLGVGWLGHAIGFLVAVAVTIALAWIAVQEGKWRVRHAAQGLDTDTRAVAAVLAGRTLAGLLRPLAIIAVALYVINAIATGTLWAVAHAALTASIEVKLIAAGSTILLGYLIGRELSDAAPQVRRAIVELQARERARANAALTSTPYVGVVFAFLAAWAWQLPILLGVIIAILAGIGFRGAVRVYHRARRRHAERDDTPPPTGSLLAACRTIDTIHGDRYCVTISGTLYAHTNIEELIETSVDVLQARAYGNDPDPTVEEWYARNLREFGLSDYHETYDAQDNSGKLPERARKRIVTELRDSPDRRSHRDHLIDDVCSDLPDEITRRRLAEMLTTPALRLHGDGTVRLKKDIWANMVDTTRDVDAQRIEQAI